MAVRILPCRLTVPFSELDGSPTENIAVEWTGFGANRSLKVAAANRMQLIKELLGYKEYVGGNLLIHQAHEYRYISNLLTAVSVTTKPFGKIAATPGDSRFADYPDSIVDVVYKIPQWRTAQFYEGLVTVTDTVQPSTEFITINTEKLYWDAAQAEPLDSMDAPGKLIHTLEWIQEIRNAIVLLPGVWGLPGYVNSYPVYSRFLNTTFPAGTLLCEPPTVDREVSFDSIPTYNITIRFVAKNNGTYAVPRGWNYFPRWNAGGTSVSWLPLYDGVGNVKIFYPFADFRNIIIP